jgi:hypothetical protein
MERCKEELNRYKDSLKYYEDKLLHYNDKLGYHNGKLEGFENEVKYYKDKVNVAKRSWNSTRKDIPRASMPSATHWLVNINIMKQWMYTGRVSNINTNIGGKHFKRHLRREQLCTVAC